MGSWNLVIGNVKETDIVLEVIDARCPRETRCGKLERVITDLGKKLIIVVNKADLVPQEFCERIKKEFCKEYPTVFVSSVKKEGTSFVRDAIMQAARGEDARVCLLGYPNTGKSSLANALAGRNAVKTSSVPGYTKKMQWVRISPKVLLSDAPGVIPFGEGFSVIKSLSRPEKLKHPEDEAEVLIKKIAEAGNGNAEELYGVRPGEEDFVEKVAAARKLVLKGGVPDTMRTARTIIQDWNSCKLTAWWM